MMEQTGQAAMQQECHKLKSMGYTATNLANYLVKNFKVMETEIFLK